MFLTSKKASKVKINNINAQSFVNLFYQKRITIKGKFMQVTNNLIPVESDVNQFLSKQRALLDNDIADLFKAFNLAKLLKECHIKKRCGHSVLKIIYDLFFVPFLWLSNIYLFVHTQYDKATTDTSLSSNKILRRASFEVRNVSKYFT
jgi:hypothetical protein